MKIGFVYAGQGSQVVEMGADLYEMYPTARQVYDDIKLDFNVKELCFSGPAEKLNQTAYTQPCMVATAIAITKLLAENGIVPEIAAGLSLGEYSALYAAGVFNEQTAIELVRFRGQVMEQAVAGLDSKMVAILGLDRKILQKICEQASSLGVVQIANYNCPGQMVIGGEATAVDEAAEQAIANNAKRVIPLKVSGPFHTILMQPAAQKLKKKFRETTFNELAIPVVFNTTAQLLQSGQTVQELLTKQVMSSVYFEDSIRKMQSEGVDTIIEIGPGRVLSSFIKKISKDITVYGVQDVKSLKTVITAL